MAILRPFVDRVVDRPALQNLAQQYPDLDIASVEAYLAFLRATAAPKKTTSCLGEGQTNPIQDSQYQKDAGFINDCTVKAIEF